MDCIFCKIANKEITSNYVYEDDKVTAFMDNDPVCDGHILIVPKKHFDTVFDLPEDLLKHMISVAEKLNEKVMKRLDEKGATLLFNYGIRQTVKHVHLHLIPNFDKKPSKSVEEVYKLLMED